MLNCQYCGKQFKPKNNGQIFCDRACANRDKASWKKKPSKKKIVTEEKGGHQSE